MFLWLEDIGREILWMYKVGLTVIVKEILIKTMDSQSVILVTIVIHYVVPGGTQ